MAKTIAISLAQFPQLMLAASYDEVIKRIWNPHEVVATYSHPFDANALVSAGELWLAIGDGEERLYKTGDHFFITANQPHRERYGSKGASYWVARKSPPT